MLKKKFNLSVLISIGLLNISTTFAKFSELKPNTNTSKPSGIDTAVNTIFGTVQWIGFIVGTAMIIYIGIKYLTAGAGKKAEVKSTLVPLLVGAVLIMLAPTIAAWLFNIFG